MVSVQLIALTPLSRCRVDRSSEVWSGRWCTRDVCSSGLGAVTMGADAEASARIDRCFNHIGIRIFIPTGAPFLFYC